MIAARIDLMDVLQDYRADLPEADPDWPYEVIQSYNCLNEHLYDDTINVTGLKEKCGINSKNFSARFRYFVGFYPKDYLIHHRISTAKIVLTSPQFCDCTLMEVALAVGFRGHSSFTKAYRKREGILPSKTLRKNRIRTG